MNAPRHTPGPWGWGADDFTPGRYSIYHNGPIAYCGDTTAKPGDGLANAQLIAAAPELLGILQGLLGLDDSNEPREVFEDHARDILQRLGVGAQ